MTQLATTVTQEEWQRDGPQTAAQKFFHAYTTAVDNYDFNKGTGLRFYAKDVTFHNQNNAEYHGADQMWTWLKQIFAQFARLRHDLLHLIEISETEGSYFLSARLRRNIWMLGNETEKPDVSIPLAFSCRIGAGDDPQAFGGLQFKEAWIYWDTAMLAPFLGKDAVVFRTNNPFEGR